MELATQLVYRLLVLSLLVDIGLPIIAVVHGSLKTKVHPLISADTATTQDSPYEDFVEFEFEEDLNDLFPGQDKSKKEVSCLNLRWGSVFTQEEIIENIQEMIPELIAKGVEPAIPLWEMSKYAQLPLTTCQLGLDGKLRFQIDLPVKTKNQNYQLYNFPPGSFGFSTPSGVCTFEYPSKGIVETSKRPTITPLTDEQWTHCLDTKVCQVPPQEEVNLSDQVCLEGIFSGKAGKELAPFCKFHCVPHDSKSNPPNPSQSIRRKEISESFFFSWILK